MGTTETTKTKTFGIKNEILLKRVGIFAIVLFLLPLVAAHYDNCDNLLCSPVMPRRVTKQPHYHHSPIMTDYHKEFVKSRNYMKLVGKHSAGFMFLEFFLFLSLLIPCCIEKMRKYAMWIWGLITIFDFFYLYNPWIIDIERKASPSSVNYHRFLWVFHIFAPAILCVHVFVTFIFWRMSKVKPDYDGDEPYKVIYGGETKKLMENEEGDLLNFC